MNDKPERGHGPPDDTLSWEAMRSQYNFRHTTPRGKVFARLVREHCAGLTRPVRVLDIGCGRGIERDIESTRTIRPVVDEFWGIEPDPSVTPPEGVFDNFQHALLEDAKLPENYFDLAYSFLVMEHVADPDSFMRAVARTLKPGGVHMFGTINGVHYFARIANFLRAIKLDEVILRIVRGKSEVDEYHYPVQYKINKTRDIDRYAAAHGFEKPDYVFIEERGADKYFPGPFKVILHALNKKRDIIRTPESLLIVMTKMRKST